MDRAGIVADVGRIPHELRAIAAIVSAVAPDELALAGSAALRAFGLVDGPPGDVDIFIRDNGGVPLDAIVAALAEHGHAVHDTGRFTLGAALQVTTPAGSVVGLDIGVHPATRLPIPSPVGPIRHPDDLCDDVAAAVLASARPKYLVRFQELQRRVDRDLLAGVLTRRRSRPERVGTVFRIVSEWTTSDDFPMLDPAGLAELRMFYADLERSLRAAGRLDEDGVLMA